MRNGVTHHHACDCREENFKKLEKQNAILFKAAQSVNEHAENCSLFIYDDKGCTCFYEKIQSALDEVKELGPSGKSERSESV